MKTIKLTDKQVKLLLSFLEELSENRSDCGCNDVYEDEVKMFSTKELQEVLNSMGKSYAKDTKKEWEETHDESESWEDALLDGWGMCDTTFIQYLIRKIEDQI